MIDPFFRDESPDSESQSVIGQMQNLHASYGTKGQITSSYHPTVTEEDLYILMKCFYDEIIELRGGQSVKALKLTEQKFMETRDKMIEQEGRIYGPKVYETTVFGANGRQYDIFY